MQQKDRSALLVSHDVEDASVRFVHGIGPNADEVTNALIHIVINDSLDTRNAVSLHGKHGRQDRRTHAAGQFQSAGWLGAITYHTGQISYHVLHCERGLFEGTTHEVSDATTRPRRGYDTTT